MIDKDENIGFGGLNMAGGLDFTDLHAEEEVIEVESTYPAAEEPLAAPSEQAAANSGEDEEFPSIFDMEGAAFLSRIEPAKDTDLIPRELEGTISIDLDNIDPKSAADKLKGAYHASLIKAAICNYLERTKFEDITIAGLLESDELSRIEMEGNDIYSAVNKLIFNESIKSKNKFVHKLYKLRPINELIDEAIMKNSAGPMLIKIRTGLQRLMMEYENAVADYTQKQLECIPAPEPVIVQNEEDKREIESLQERVEELLGQLEKSEKVWIETLQDVALLNNAQNKEDVVFAITDYVEACNETEQMLKDELSMEQEGSSALKQINERLQTEIDDLKTELDASREYAHRLEEENKEPYPDAEHEMRQEPSPETIEDQEYIDEDQEEEEPQKKSGLKIVMIVAAAILAFIVLFFVIGGILIGQDEQPQPISYVTEKPSDKQKQDATSSQPEPAVATVTPEEVATVAEYDFSKLLSEEEFAAQKFDIYGGNYKKIRVNGKDFASNDIINGYKFIKATSMGKMLFINQNNEPVWVTMKD